MSFVTAFIVSTDNLIHVITAKQVGVNPLDQTYRNEDSWHSSMGKTEKEEGFSIRNHEKQFSIRRKIIL